MKSCNAKGWLLLTGTGSKDYKCYKKVKYLLAMTHNIFHLVKELEQNYKRPGSANLFATALSGSLVHCGSKRGHRT